MTGFPSAITLYGKFTADADMKYVLMLVLVHLRLPHAAWYQLTSNFVACFGASQWGAQTQALCQILGGGEEMFYMEQQRQDTFLFSESTCRKKGSSLGALDCKDILVGQKYRNYCLNRTIAKTFLVTSKGITIMTPVVSEIGQSGTDPTKQADTKKGVSIGNWHSSAGSDFPYTASFISL